MTFSITFYKIDIGLRPSSFLWNFHSHPEIKRQKHQGRYVYFASEPARYAQQRQNRIMMRQTKRLPSEFEAIAILVEKIKYPQLSLEELADKLKGKNLCIAPEAIENLFLHHDLVIKKDWKKLATYLLNCQYLKKRKLLPSLFPDTNRLPALTLA